MNIYICINKHGKALTSISASTVVLMHSDFLNKLMRKIHAKQCLVLYLKDGRHNKRMRHSN